MARYFDTPRDLLEAWVDAAGSVASEYSSDMRKSYREIVDKAKATAIHLGIPWDDSIASGLIEDLRDIWEEEL
jgi:hypothetical protein